MKYYERKNVIDLVLERKNKEGVEMLDVTFPDGSVKQFTQEEFDELYEKAFNELYEESNNNFYESFADIFIGYLKDEVGDISTINIDMLDDEDCLAYCRRKWLFENEECSYADACEIIETINEKLNKILNLEEVVSIYPWEEDAGLCVWSTKYVLENPDMFRSRNEEFFDMLMEKYKDKYLLDECEDEDDEF